MSVSCARLLIYLVNDSYINESTGFRTPTFGWLHIQQAWLVGSGDSATLSARKLVSIPPIRRDATTRAVALSGDLVARNVYEGRNKWIEVFRWKECTPTELQVAIMRVSATMGNVRFLMSLAELGL